MNSSYSDFQSRCTKLPTNYYFHYLRKMNDDNTNSELNEPSAEYSLNKRITFFGSNEEAELYHHEQMANKTPLQRLHDTVELIKKVFAKELAEKPKNANRITFLKNGHTS